MGRFRRLDSHSAMISSRRSASRSLTRGIAPGGNLPPRTSPGGETFGGASQGTGSNSFLALRLARVFWRAYSLLAFLIIGQIR